MMMYCISRKAEETTGMEMVVSSSMHCSELSGGNRENPTWAWAALIKSMDMAKMRSIACRGDSGSPLEMQVQVVMSSKARRAVVAVVMIV